MQPLTRDIAITVADFTLAIALQNLAWGLPLLVMDMYEHAYQMDYGAAAAKYVDAFMLNINWEEVNRRVDNLGKTILN